MVHGLCISLFEDVSFDFLILHLTTNVYKVTFIYKLSSTHHKINTQGVWHMSSLITFLLLMRARHSNKYECVKLPSCVSILIFSFHLFWVSSCTFIRYKNSNIKSLLSVHSQNFSQASNNDAQYSKSFKISIIN